MSDNLTALFLGAAAEGIEKKKLFEELKRGKSKEQKAVIDFFASEYGGAGCGCKKGLGKKLTLQDYQAMVMARCNSYNFREKAIQKIGLDERQISEIAPICLSSFVYDKDTFEYIDGNQAVSSQFSVTWIFFSATQLYTYNFIFDMTSDNTWETTRDFFYQDITSFQTQHRVVEKIRHEMGGCIIKRDSSYRENYIVDTLRIIVPGFDYDISMTDAPGVEQTLQGAKAMVRERKFNK